jgi:ABC-2 type transport system ATP-binding protein
MIETRDLTKKYGELFAVDRLTLRLEPGDVYGFIGPNGSGKTTTMRMLATLLNPSWGEASVCGYSIYTGSKEIRRAIGYMPDFFGVYDDMKVLEYLEFFAAAYRIRGPERRKKCESVLELVDLGYKRDALVTSLSRGMTQRLGLARVLLHEPQVLLLDEPASGLDPRARIEMRELLKQLRSMKKTIMLSSHILPELADICNKIGIIERGRLLFNGDVETARRQVRQAFIFEVAVLDNRNHDAARELEKRSEIAKIEIVVKEDASRIKEEAIRATLAPGADDGSFIPAALLNAGYKLRMFREEKIDLEDVFMGITKGITN